MKGILEIINTLHLSAITLSKITLILTGIMIGLISTSYHYPDSRALIYNSLALISIYLGLRNEQ